MEIRYIKNKTDVVNLILVSFCGIIYVYGKPLYKGGNFMGILDNIRNIFRGNESQQPVIQKNDYAERMDKVYKILDLKEKFLKLNSWDSSVMNIRETTLKTKSLLELEEIEKNLNDLLFKQNNKNQQRNPQMESLEASKWTGQKTPGMTDHDFDRFQDDGK